MLCVTMNDALRTADTLPPPSSDRRLANADFLLRDAIAKFDSIKATAREVERRLLHMAATNSDRGQRLELVELVRMLEIARGAR